MGNGNALGVLIGEATSKRGTNVGVSLARVLDTLHRDGWELELVTAPFDIADAPTKVQDFLRQCTMRPIEKLGPSDVSDPPIRPDPGVPRLGDSP